MIQEKGKSKLLLLFGISFLSISMFIYQVILTRVISAIFTYHYTFIITSFSILGLGIGGIIAYRQLKNNKTNNQFLKDNLIKKIVLMPISYIFVLGLFYILPFSINILVYIIPAMVPFIIGGYILSSIYSEFSDISNKLYFADLIGSGLGSILVLFSLNYLGVIKSIILISIISSIAVIFFVNFLSKKYIIAYAVLGMFVVSIFVPQNYISALEKNFGSIITSKLKTFGSIISSGDKAEIVYTKWNAFSRTDVIRVDNDPNEMIVTIDGTASSPMYKFDGKDGSLDIYKKDVEYLPYTFGKKDNVLIIGPGGGRDNLINKIIISSILVMIPGFFMGMPFPRGIRLLGAGDKNVIPIAWGINGAMSVIGSILSVIISMIFGFKITLITGAIIYGLICLYNRDRLIL
ncbi:hypothetical protein PQV03_09220 [Thermoanaerobacterium thermosaccharolyticum]|jgi:hypothetical protein|uniref:hypothetical protein n=1 Tax=Thermoanaerobacterium thermosaccharolyticum TaxID=1517 RepID=UPI003D2E7B79